MLQFLVFVIGLNAAVQAQSGCPTSPIVLDFNATRYLGKWYEIKSFPSFFQPEGTSCVSATYGDGGYNNITVLNQAVLPTNEITKIEGSATVPDINKPNYLVVVLKVQIAPNIFFPTSGKYDVWETDYENYALLYSCSFTQATETAWILSRTRTLSDKTIQDLEDRLKSKGIDPSKFRLTKQTDCQI